MSKRIIKRAAVTALSVPVMMVPYYSLVAGEQCDQPPERCVPTQSHEHDFEVKQVSTYTDNGATYEVAVPGPLPMVADDDFTLRMMEVARENHRRLREGQNRVAVQTQLLNQRGDEVIVSKRPDAA